MFSRILVPLDGTPGSEHALPWALALAERAGAAVTLVRVHQVLPPIVVSTEMTGDIAVDQTLREEEQAHLQRMGEQVATSTTAAVSWKFLEGTAVEQIREFVAAENIDLVVMTTHGRGPFLRLLLGSVADKLARSLHTPVLFIRPPADESPADLSQRPRLTCVWVPLDGSPLAEQVLGAAEAFSDLTEASLALVSVAEGDDPATALLVEHPPAMPEYAEPDEPELPARRYLEAIAGQLSNQARGVEIRVVAGRPVVKGILEQIADPAAEAIALATHGHGGLTRVLLGSVADEIVRHAKCPVLVYRPRHAQ